MEKTALFRKFIVGATAAFLLFTCFIEPCFADFNSYGVPDSVEVRKNLTDSWFKAPVGQLRYKQNEYYNNSIGETFQVRFEEGYDEVAVIVAPLVLQDMQHFNDSNPEEEMTTTFAETYPTGARGSWVLYRNKATGAPTRIIWYFNQDADVYLQLKPMGSKTLADLVVYKHYCVKGTPVGVPFDRFYSASFAEVKNWTLKTIPWKKVTVIPGQYHASFLMGQKIRSRLSDIEFLEDACYNEKGQLYSILNNEPFQKKPVYDENGRQIVKVFPQDHLELSGAGFLKWIVDGILNAFTGKPTTIDQLSAETVEYNSLGKSGIIAQKYNLSYTLDWTRNLGVAALNARGARQFAYKDSGVDLNLNHFTNVSGYLKDSGYPLELLKGLLYIQANIEPGYAYLAAVKQYSVIKRDEFVFNQCCIFFPFFDDNGRFGCMVFMDGKEISLDDFIVSYSKGGTCYVNLVRLRASDDFYPQ